jgi:cyclopropane-fatty-acyl-phospholipid synthase
MPFGTARMPIFASAIHFSGTMHLSFHEHRLSFLKAVFSLESGIRGEATQNQATMLDSFFRKRFLALLDAASIRVDGNNPWDIRVHDPRFYRKAMLQANLGLGESYMDGWWDCSDLYECFFRLLCAEAEQQALVPLNRIHSLAGKLFNFQKPSRAFTIGKKHYDTGNDLFIAMLGRTMMYSCAFWQDAADLDTAQENKLNLIFRKLGLKPDMRVLDIGCGWGGAARFAAEHYGARIVGITVSNSQAAFARELCSGLPVEIRFMDYRDLTDSYDRIFSIGMLEHVGHKNYGTFFDIVRRCLKPDGLCLLQTIGGNLPVSGTDPWISRYIFPNSMIPSASQITAAFEGRLVLEDWQVFAHDYALTLKAWLHNVEHHWPDLQKNYSERFRRMWRYYLLSCAGAFRARLIQVWQILLSPEGLKGPYPMVQQPGSD